ncbi:secreted protein [Melampsora americana]|nr:secreted protein [Melampsora americana]
MNPASLIGTIVLLCTSSAIVQAMAIKAGDEVMSCQPVIVESEIQSVNKGDMVSTVSQGQAHEGGCPHSDTDEPCSSCASGGGPYN